MLIKKKQPPASSSFAGNVPFAKAAASFLYSAAPAGSYL